MVGKYSAKCSATNNDGGPCNAQGWRDGLCRWNHPALEAERAEGRRRGGSQSSNRARARKQYAGEVLTLREVQGLLSKTLKDVIEGSVETGVATAAASVARAIAAVAQVGDLEERIAELEAAAGVQRRQA